MILTNPDLVTRLRVRRWKEAGEAADEIERLRAIIQNVALALGYDADSVPLIEDNK